MSDNNTTTQDKKRLRVLYFPALMHRWEDAPEDAHARVHEGGRR